ncbi:hypothetical protein IGI04_041198 [Brassica rapa subsp. trilocularis]|uniref:Uncharacterized protein n=1 Tax=Brassica rapa subsp. trilocularis TaxID=1813537 RepID=A0ABQ7KRK5_BRACM|nr:hypothetical protein IGI04_041198 [Brassica rapa subsp. trilocularis]
MIKTTNLRNPLCHEVGDTGNLTCLRRDQNAVAKTETKPLRIREDKDDQKRERRRCSGDCMRRRAGGGELRQGHLECEEPPMKKVRMEVVWKRKGHDLL